MVRQLKIDIAGSAAYKTLKERFDDVLAETIVKHGAARVTIEVEPLEAPEMGTPVVTPDGPGAVRLPVTELYDIVVELEDGSRWSGDLDELEGYDR